MCLTVGCHKYAARKRAVIEGFRLDYQLLATGVGEELTDIDELLIFFTCRVTNEGKSPLERYLKVDSPDCMVFISKIDAQKTQLSLMPLKPVLLEQRLPPS